MEDEKNKLHAVLSHAEPILAVRDISKTISYWQNTLGFPDKWTWGEPPNHGSVSRDGVYIQFSQNHELASVSKGNALFIRVQHLETLYHFHQNKNAEIVEPLENKPWGLASYTVREINGYYLFFAGALLSDREQRSSELPQIIRIVTRKPVVKEYQHLASAIGWSAFINDAITEKVLAAPLFAVVAEDTTSNEVIGCALLLGDNASFYYVKDVMVHPDWQNRRVGTALMQELTHWLDSNARDNAFVVLITPEKLASFYQQFGFTSAFGMIREIQPSEQ